jgi:hypothetical protein
MTIRRAALAIFVLLFTTSVHAGEFDRISSAIERSANLEREWIPFFGLARTVVRAASPSGVYDIQLAVYSGRNADWNRLQTAFSTAAGPTFRPMVRARERDGDSTLILARPHGKDHVELLILNRDDEDTVLIRLVADPEEVSRIANDGDIDISFH